MGRKRDRKAKAGILLIGLAVASLSLPAFARWELSASASLETRYFPKEPQNDSQHKHGSISAAIEPRFNAQWNRGRQTFELVPFARWDENDERRTHADLRVASYTHAFDNFELSLGIQKIFWGVTESQHLVDIVNQTDLVEGYDGEQKLGQPMIRLSAASMHGNWDLFVMSGFRERTFPGETGRFRAAMLINTDEDPNFESSMKHWQPDAAIRWSHSMGAFDVGVYHFYGTNREPTFELKKDDKGNPYLLPSYSIIHQSGIDAQATISSLLLKLEGIAVRDKGFRHQYLAGTGGFEYTFYQAFGRGADLGVLAEYSHDSRPQEESTKLDNDIFAGIRLSISDVDETSFLIGTLFNLDSRQNAYTLEASRRIGNEWKVSAKAGLFSTVDNNQHPTAPLQRDDFIQLELGYYFLP